MTFDIGLILAQLPLRVSVPLMLFIAVSISLIGTWVVNAVYAFGELEPNNNIGGVKFQFMGEIFAVTLGLALIGAFDHYSQARDSAQREVSNLQALSWAADAYNLPEQTAARNQMKSAIREYSRAVVEREWTTMSFGIQSFEVTHRFRELTEAFSLVEPRNGAQEVLQQNTVEWVRVVGELRNFRLTTVSRSLIALVWMILLFGTAIAIGFPWFFGVTSFATHAIMSTLMTSFIVLHLVVIVHLAYPFLGETAVSPDGFVVLAR